MHTKQVPRRKIWEKNLSKDLIKLLSSERTLLSGFKFLCKPSDTFS
ncbi:hypothetical protein CCPUN_06030 [Cardinium endosymbiont of Culicoides punctatus]|nr:hypothetical protein CCPUN_06030 [Cardinium endosymbiont of Culicoides punctatus]